MATRKKATRAIPSLSRDEITEDDCKAAERILDIDYMNDVRGVAKDLARQMKEGEVEDFSDALHQAVDGTQRVIYTHQAKLALVFSPNADAYFEEFGEEGAIENGGIAWERLAFVAMQQDVLKELDVRSVDVNDPDSWPDIDLSEFD